MHLDDVLTELVEHSGDRLLRVAYQLTHDAAAAQDLVQEALLHVCVAASNGEFTSSGIIGPAVSKAFTSGWWPASPPVLVSILVGRHPAMDNDDLQATSASSVVPVIRQLLKPA